MSDNRPKEYDDLRAFCTKHGYPLSDDQVMMFDKYKTALYKANSMMNLTRVSEQDCELRHFIDSLLLIDLIPQGAKVLDIGTGPGFPAWPLACARPDIRVVAADSSGKMLQFLQSQHLPNLSVHHGRAEESEFTEQFDFVTGRAVAPLPLQIELSARACMIGGLVVPMRTPQELELAKTLNVAQLGLSLLRVETRTLPGTDIVRLFPIYEKVSGTPPRFPRSWAEMKRKPLS